MWKACRETLPLGTTSLTFNWKISPQTGISQQQPADRDAGKQDPEPCLSFELCREKLLQGKLMAGHSQGTGRGLQHLWSWEHSRDVGKEGGMICCFLWHGAKGAPKKITKIKLIFCAADHWKTGFISMGYNGTNPNPCHI